MGDSLRNVTVKIILFLGEGVLEGPVVFYELVHDLVLKGFGIGYCWLFRLIDSIEYFESLVAYKFVISIDKKGNLFIFTDIGEGPM